MLKKILNIFCNLFCDKVTTKDNNYLRPQTNIQKVLVSTPSRLVGEFTKDNEFSIAQAFHSIMDRTGFENSTRENPYSRNYYVISFYHVDEGIGNGSLRILNDYTKIGESFCICLSVLFGKRFDYHGLLENRGIYGLPYFPNTLPIKNYNYPYNNHKKRADLDINLNLANVGIIDRLIWDNSLDNKFVRVFETAGQFYLNALQIFDTEPELAYINLITSLEVLSNYYEYEDSDLYDESLQKLLDEIKDKLENGEKKAKSISQRLFQVKRKYWLLVDKLVNDNFFTVTESNILPLSFRKDNFEKIVKAAYDLRSRFVHTGVKFGKFIETNAGIMNESPQGSVVIDDTDFKKILDKSPSFTGLERIVRYCLLSFIHSEGFRIDNRLN